MLKHQKNALKKCPKKLKFIFNKNTILNLKHKKHIIMKNLIKNI